MLRAAGGGVGVSVRGEIGGKEAGRGLHWAFVKPLFSASALTP